MRKLAKSSTTSQTASETATMRLEGSEYRYQAADKISESQLLAQKRQGKQMLPSETATNLGMYLP